MGLFQSNYSKSLRDQASPASHGSGAKIRKSGLSSQNFENQNSHNYPQASVQLPLAALQAVVDQKGLDARALDVHESDITDYFVIASGTSDRHVKGIVDRVRQELGKIGEIPLSVGGYEKGEWVLVDYGDLIVHVFYEPMRQHYGLDELWATRATEIELPAELERHIKLLKTGIPWDHVHR